MRIRGNGHYRNLCGGTLSRNAYRSAARGRLLGNLESAFALSFTKRKDIKNKMKIQMKKLAAICLALAMIMLFVACNADDSSLESVSESETFSEAITGKWLEAKYLTDTELGVGSKTVIVTVKAEEKEISFIIHTDKTHLGDALLEHNLIEGEQSEFGLYVKKVNGMLADYDVDKTYWGFYKGGEMMMVGVSAAEFASGDCFELVLES